MSTAACVILGLGIFIMLFVAWCNYTPAKDKNAIMQLEQEAPYKLEPPDKTDEVK